MKRYKNSISLEIVAEWETMYLSEITPPEIARKYGVDSSTVRKRLLKDFGLKTSSSKRNKNRAYQYPESFFRSPLTREESWVLGLIMADGTISEKYIALGSLDTDVIHKLKVIFGSGSISDLTHSGAYTSTYLRLTIGSKELVRRFNQLGVKRNKSLTIQYPSHVDLVTKDFIRGVWDGDGFITGSTFPKIGLCSASKDFLISVREVILMELDINISSVTSGNRVYEIRASKKSAVKLLQWLYTDTPEHLRMNRKHKSAMRWI